MASRSAKLCCAVLQAIVACIVLGSQAQDNEVKVTCTVRRHSTFWDALSQLQQQGITQELLQQAGGSMLAKLFPRFVDEDVLTNVQQPMPAAAAVEAGEGHGPRKEFFQAAAHNWTTAGPQQVSSALQDQQPAYPSWDACATVVRACMYCS